ncbi:hypothetical protein BKA70DRAFT_94474 [Coprinopsis sp. MPI-PUGE-AT-0042]|nr:hypothetical protein BKA70DRAFT_94474 [Coprinopsis sp. MPI-PUGE-AT-0042]
MDNDCQRLTFYCYTGKPYRVSWQERLAHLHPLVSNGIPCSLWGFDAACYLSTNTPDQVEQEIIVPDDTINDTCQILEQAGYIFRPPCAEYLKGLEEINVPNPFPNTLSFKHPSFLNDCKGIGAAPRDVKVHPQSYFGVDIRTEQENPNRFALLPAILDERILVPDYHTLLEGLVHYLMNPPSGGIVNIYTRGQMIDLILSVRELLGDQEDQVLKRLTTDEAKWYFEILGKEGWPSQRDILEYKDRQIRLSYQYARLFSTLSAVADMI